MWHIEFYTKPTKHEQYCKRFDCRKELHKGDSIARICRGEIQRANTFDVFHFDCFMIEFVKLLAEYKGMSEVIPTISKAMKLMVVDAI